MEHVGPAAQDSGEGLDPWLFGWDPEPGIVSVWADAGGRALVWQRRGEGVTCVEQRFRPWLFATTLDDLAHLGARLREGDPQERHGQITYQQLAGPPGSYRYLLSAPSWRQLEGAIVGGAARRLGRPGVRVYDLDEYYRVGFVEQYLMQSGRAYFRGMTYADLHRLQFDLETTALDPAQGRIFLASVRDSRGFEAVLEAPSPDDEPRLIKQLCALIAERDPDVVENHNLYGFDLPFLEGRATVHGVALRLGRREGPGLLERYEEPAGWGRGSRRRTVYTVAGRELIDTLPAVWRYNFSTYELTSYRLKEVARHFGLAAPDRVYLPGAAVYETYRREPEQVRRYALDDVREVDGLSQRLLGAPFALAGMAPRRFSRLLTAGPAMGILEPMLVRAYLHARAALPYNASSHDAGLAGHAGGAVHLFASGVARHVVKADIASMYPSIMRTFQIGSAHDQLGVLLHLVDRLTALRLEHKEAARQAARDSLEAGHHNALQLAMKILINSAYGYLGAGAMALFADRRAADEVTRRGREILGQVVDQLRRHGMQLIEADTDGVYFAVPSSWGPEQERALVAQVARTLPERIHLEYEGRYAAMFSHEVKNYALLSHDGRLTVRGAALRSSRSEPFGERFLLQALRLVMQGQVAALERLYRETVEALRSHAIPVEDVATRVRLTKTPEEYQRVRAGHREASYEALLGAGRGAWQPGERVRYYRAADGSSVWLPDETDEPSAGSDAEEELDGALQAVTEPGAPRRPTGILPAVLPDYDTEYYVNTLLTSYAGRLRKAFAPADFDQLFRADGQTSLFDRPVEEIQPLWIRCNGEGLDGNTERGFLNHRDTEHTEG